MPAHKQNSRANARPAHDRPLALIVNARWKIFWLRWKPVICAKFSMYGHDSKACRKNVKKQWVEKRRPSKEDIEEIDDKLKENRIFEEELIEDHRVDGGGAVMLTTQPESFIEPSTTHQGESSAGWLGVVDKNISTASVRGGVEIDKDIGQNSQWTTVLTRSKAQERYESMKAEAAKPPSNG
ncbi:hypothetical protein RIF29_14819 [Crotalaria pallida]|uniref:Uncharacterized protein n=1 Tax=Crotalaria pallida TaxID=3830 RepID=A0AAN9FEG9_CROPI